MNLRSVSILIILLALAYSSLVALQQQPKLWDWLNTLAATGISFFLALVAGFYLFNQQASSTRESNGSELRQLLVAELSDLSRILRDSSRMTVHFPGRGEISILIAFVQPLIIEKAALSGLFGNVESENLLHAARKVRMFNVKCNYLLGLLQSRSEPDTLIHANNNLEETRLAIIDTINHLASQLNLHLTEAYPD